jgi:hypothetical protein
MDRPKVSPFGFEGGEIAEEAPRVHAERAANHKLAPRPEADIGFRSFAEDPRGIGWS